MLPQPMFMEEEEEVLAVKKIPVPYSPSRKSLSRVSSEIITTPTSAANSPRVSVVSESSFPMSSKKPYKRSAVGPKVSDGGFTREDRVDQLTSAVSKVIENNNLLRDKCK